MADGMMVKSDVCIQIFAISLLDLCLWGLHFAEIKDSGIYTENQTSGWWFCGRL